MRNHRLTLRYILLGFVVLALSACGGGGGGGSSAPPGPSGYTVGGSVNGLSGSVTLQLNGTENLTIGAAGGVATTFKFGVTTLANAASYTVTVLTQPVNQTCTVGGGSGSVSGANVSNVAVTCTGGYTIGGSVSGLSGTVVLRLNGIAVLDVSQSTNGNFAFSTAITSGAAYNVTIVTQPSGQTCTVSSGNGVVNAASVANVAVVCSNGTTNYTVGGTVTGLTASGLKLTLLSGGAVLEDLPVAANSATFTFTTTFTSATGTNVVITDANQPAGATCIVGNPLNQAGTVNVNAVQVACAARTTNALQGTYRVGLPNTGARSFITFYANGSYVFSNHTNDNGIITDVEYGIYNWNSTTHAFTVPVLLIDRIDTGMTDLHDGKISAEIAVSGANLVFTVHETGIPDENITAYPVPNTTGGLAGVWTSAYARDVTIFLADGTFMSTISSLNMSLTVANSPTNLNGIEDACYSSGGGVLTYTVTGCVVDTSNSLPGINANGNPGWINNAGNQPTWNYSVSGDTLTLVNNSNTANTFALTRVH